VLSLSSEESVDAERQKNEQAHESHLKKVPECDLAAQYHLLGSANKRRPYDRNQESVGRRYDDPIWRWNE
jgi:hypothetical protein